MPHLTTEQLLDLAEGTAPDPKVGPTDVEQATAGLKEIVH